jgi:hypothetical protein
MCLNILRSHHLSYIGLDTCARQVRMSPSTDPESAEEEVDTMLSPKGGETKPSPFEAKESARSRSRRRRESGSADRGSRQQKRKK